MTRILLLRRFVYRISAWHRDLPLPIARFELLWLRTAEPPVPRFLPVCVEALGELGLLTEPFALPVEDVDGYSDHERKTG